MSVPIQQTKSGVYVEVGPAKIVGGNSPLTYVALAGVIAIVLFYIYAKYIHTHARRMVGNVHRRISRKK